VKAFQSDNGLTADGVVGAATYAKLNVAHIMKYDTRTANWRVLSLNKKGDDVAQLQFRLQDRSLYSGAIDGIYGSGTQSAVIAFQHQKGLTEDGIAGSTTMWWLAYSP
jgi:peptidoglycan hydrolase-like protein with peptidoglycan-binding domain